jgi:DNA polymerase I
MKWKSVWAIDFEFATKPGENPTPLCVVAHDIVSGHHTRHWIDPSNPGPCPYPTGAEDLVIAYAVGAEMSCHLVLGWQVPERLIDLYVEFRRHTNGKFLPHGAGQLGAMLFFGLNPGIAKEEKQAMQQLAAGGGPFTEEQKRELTDYCALDVDCLVRLWHTMKDGIDTPRALIRGQFAAAMAEIEHRGIPIDAALWRKTVQRLPEIKPRLVADLDADYGVFEGTRFVEAKFAALIERKGIRGWPRTATGRFSHDAETMKAMSQAHPEFQTLRELLRSVSEMRLGDLEVGSDGRNRTAQRPFATKTARNAPSTTKHIMGPSVWIRAFITPAPGTALIALDYSQQEFGIGAALSKDRNMMTAYEASDPYIEFAILAGAAPNGATKETHPAERARFKQTVLATQYGAGPQLVADRVGLPKIYGKDLLDAHRNVFPRFWRWVADCSTTARALRRATSTFGWQMWVTPETKERTIQNFACQCNGAEMLRLVVLAMRGRPYHIVSTIHDAVLIEAKADDADKVAEEAAAIMQEASRVVLNGFTIRTEAKIIRFGQRYEDERGLKMWRKVFELVGADMDHSDTPTCITAIHPSPSLYIL